MRWMRGFAAFAMTTAVVTACASEPSSGNDDNEIVQGANLQRPDSHPDLLVKDPATLTALEGRFPFAAMIGATGTSGAELAASSAAYRTLVQTVKSDVDAEHAGDRSSGKGFAYSHRLFDDTWLTSHAVRFELTGIANRLDLAYRGGCGEIHLVYRLAYTTGQGDDRIDSRLPFTVNVLLPIADDGAQCRTVASSWAGVQGGDIANKLVAGPLAKPTKPSRVEINFQIVRWPSTVRPDLGGHAEYMLRAFELGNGNLVPVALDDTPRTDLSSSERAALKTWIGENIAKIDDGTARIPEQFLATTTRSVAPRAASRLGNKPFHALFEASDLGALPLASTSTVRSPEALLHKLDGLSCNGCHQARGIAGFHLLGEERSGTARLNALAVGASPHLVDVLGWRQALNEAVAAGKPAPKRNAPDHASGRPGAYGAHCGLGDPGFAEWTCQSGLACQRVDDDVLGRCLPKGNNIGDACESTTVSQTLDPTADKATVTTLTCKGGVTCMGSKSGFPDGLCETRCETLGAVDGDEICAPVPFGSGPLGGFNHCLFELKKPFAVCLADDARPTASRKCDESNPCRDDYACARVYVKPGSVEQAPESGACMPPYFVFQGRVDGHVIPQ